MHYLDGTEVKLGDVCRSKAKPEFIENYQYVEMMGIVTSGSVGAQSCNINVRVLATRSVGPLGTTAWYPYTCVNDWCATAGECELVSR